MADDGDSKGEMYVSGGPYGVKGADGEGLVLGGTGDDDNEETDIQALRSGEKALSDCDAMVALKRQPIMEWAVEEQELSADEIAQRLNLRTEVVESALAWHGLSDQPRPPAPPWSNDPTGADRVQSRRSGGNGGESGRNQSF